MKIEITALTQSGKGSDDLLLTERDPRWASMSLWASIFISASSFCSHPLCVMKRGGKAKGISLGLSHRDKTVLLQLVENQSSLLRLILLLV